MKAVLYLLSVVVIAAAATYGFTKQHGRLHWYSNDPCIWPPLSAIRWEKVVAMVIYIKFIAGCVFHDHDILYS